MLLLTLYLKAVQFTQGFAALNFSPTHFLFSEEIFSNLWVFFPMFYSFCSCISLSTSVISFAKFAYLSLKYFLIDFLCVLVTLGCSMCVGSCLLFFLFLHVSLIIFCTGSIFDGSSWSEFGIQQIVGVAPRLSCFSLLRFACSLFFPYLKNMTCKRSLVKHISKM